MEYKEVAKAIANGNEDYIGRVVSKKPNFFSNFFGQPRNRVYYLEVQNKTSDRIKRKKVGCGGVALVGSSVVFYDTTIQSIAFTEQGLEVVVTRTSEDGCSLFAPTNIHRGDVFLIPRSRFPK